MQLYGDNKSDNFLQFKYFIQAYYMRISLIFYMRLHWTSSYIHFSCFVDPVHLGLKLSNPVFLPTAYSPALICFGRERGWWITCNYPTVLKEKHIEIQKEYNLGYLLANVRTTWGKASDRLRRRANKRNKNRVGRLPTSEQNWKIILSDEVRCGSERVNFCKEPTWRIILFSYTGCPTS
jgi:hypothetical protein